MVSDEIRALLRMKLNNDGLTVKQLAARLGYDRHTVYRALNGRHMPDAYVDRWDGESAIWICVPVPENCPRPRDVEKHHERDHSEDLGCLARGEAG